MASFGNDLEDLAESGEENELAQSIKLEKASKPSMFISGWEEDDNDIEEKDLTDPIEQFLTAAEDGDIERLEQLYSADHGLLMAQDRDKYTALHRAAYNDRKEACLWLLEKGADPEMRTAEGWTALHCAARWENYEIVAILLSHGVDVNSRTQGKIVPLHLALNSSGENPERQYLTVKYLLEAPGIEMNAVNGAGDTPLSLARRTNRKLLDLLETHMR